MGFEEELGVVVVGSVMNDWAFWRRLERVPVNIVVEGREGYWISCQSCSVDDGLICVTGCRGCQKSINKEFICPYLNRPG